ncbi:MAG TPA: hypothetical protein VHC49_17915 [Mycobacteriales bacterium]|nr:hypothetical protein [Mycobacteriales bacterium]
MAIPVPPGWTTGPTSDGELLRATTTGARMSAALVPLTDPRRTIPQRVRQAAGGEPTVTTSYLDIPVGRAVLAQATAERAVAQLWLPLPESHDALVVEIVADDPGHGAAAAHVVTEIGARLTREDTVVRRRGPISARTVALCTAHEPAPALPAVVGSDV